MLPIVALVGKPNTGKSTLFNRILGQQHAITSHIAGTTRDRTYREVELETGKKVLLVDTGGILFNAETDLNDDIIKQAKLGIAEADLIVFTVDCSEPLTAADQEVTQILRKSRKPIIVAANKQDCKSAKTYTDELVRLGFSDVLPISAIHNLGLSELEELISKRLPKAPKQIDNKSIKLGFIGKPNVGKSSLINSLLGREQVIVSPISGTTLDSTHLPFSEGDQEYTLIDTAGIRRRGKQVGLEKFGVLRTMQTINEVDIAFLIMDGSIGLAKQDMHVSEYILKGAKGLVIVVNKADLMKPEEKNQLLGYLQHRLKYVPWAPVIFTSAATGTNVPMMLEIAKKIFADQHRRLKINDINYFIKKLVLKHPPKTNSKHQAKIQFVTQSEGTPPQFVFFCRHADKLHFSYKRYLENKIRDEYGFEGVNIDLAFKEASTDGERPRPTRTRRKK